MPSPEGLGPYEHGWLYSMEPPWGGKGAANGNAVWSTSPSVPSRKKGPPRARGAGKRGNQETTAGPFPGTMRDILGRPSVSRPFIIPAERWWPGCCKWEGTTSPFLIVRAPGPVRRACEQSLDFHRDAPDRRSLSSPSPFPRQLYRAAFQLGEGLEHKCRLSRNIADWNLNHGLSRFSSPPRLNAMLVPCQVIVVNTTVSL